MSSERIINKRNSLSTFRPKPEAIIDVIRSHQAAMALQYIFDRL